MSATDLWFRERLADGHDARSEDPVNEVAADEVLQVGGEPERNDIGRRKLGVCTVDAWQDLSHRNKPGGARQLETTWRPASDGENKGREATGGDLECKLLAHPPEFDGTVHGTNHVLKNWRSVSGASRTTYTDNSHS